MFDPYIVFFLFLPVNTESSSFEFQVNKAGSYTLNIDGKKWLESGPIFFNGYGKTWSTDSVDRKLVLRNVTTISGGDVTEQWRETQFTYSLGDTKTSVVAAIRLFSGSVDSSRVLFTQVCGAILSPWLFKLYLLLICLPHKV